MVAVERRGRSLTSCPRQKRSLLISGAGTFDCDSADPQGTAISTTAIAAATVTSMARIIATRTRRMKLLTGVGSSGGRGSSVIGASSHRGQRAVGGARREAYRMFARAPAVFAVTSDGGVGAHPHHHLMSHRPDRSRSGRQRVGPQSATRCLRHERTCLFDGDRGKPSPPPAPITRRDAGPSDR
jgi:hypothetical protein